MFENLRKYDIILASNSPRRRELLARLGIEFKVFTLMGIEECYPQGLTNEEVALHIAKSKATAYQSYLKPNSMIITADTIVCLEDRILGKPENTAQAQEMLRALSGKEHSVVTAFTISTQERYVQEVVTTTVKFAHLDNNVIDHYVTKYLPLDKAGSYGIQEWIGLVAVEEIHGSFFNVMGLPIHRISQVLRDF